MNLVAEVDRYELYFSSGYDSTEAWLVTYLGMGFMRSIEYVRIAVGLQGLPLLREAYRTGIFSYDHLRALIQVINPDNEARLLEECQGRSVSDTFHMVDTLKKLDAVDSQIARSERYLEMSWDKEGRALLLNGRLPEEAGAQVEKAIDALAAKIPDEEGEDFTSMAAKRADALCQMAGAVVTKHPAKATVVVHIGAEALTSNEGSAEIVGGPAVAPETVRRLLCGGNLSMVVDLPDGTYLEAGPQTSTLTRNKRRQILKRDKRCRVPGCRRKKVVEVHHIQWRCNGGGHELSNLVLLCEHHHRCVHEGGFSIRGTPPFIWLDHPRSPPVRTGPPTLIGQIKDSYQVERELVAAKGPGPDP